jgi:ADP-ribose pyrophosphatase YjhB (NUDIX family)
MAYHSRMMNRPPSLPSHQPANAHERFCSRCGCELALREEGGRFRHACAKCGHIVFGRFSVGVGGLLVHEGRVLVVQRGHEPGKGRWTLPGGFVEEDESPEAAIVRELKEETNLATEAGGILAIRHAQGVYDQNLYMVFGLRLVGPASDLKADGHETAQALFAEKGELDAIGSFGMISKWIIERFTPDGAGLFAVPPSSQPASVPVHQWTAIYTARLPDLHGKDPQGD